MFVLLCVVMHQLKYLPPPILRCFYTIFIIIFQPQTQGRGRFHSIFLGDRQTHQWTLYPLFSHLIFLCSLQDNKMIINPLFFQSNCFPLFHCYHGLYTINRIIQISLQRNIGHWKDLGDHQSMKVRLYRRTHVLEQLEWLVDFVQFQKKRTSSH